MADETETKSAEEKKAEAAAAKEAEAAAKEAEEKKAAAEAEEAERAAAVVPTPEPMSEEEYSEARQEAAMENAPAGVGPTEVVNQDVDQTVAPVRTAEGAGARLSGEGVESTG